MVCSVQVSMMRSKCSAKGNRLWWFDLTRFHRRNDLIINIKEMRLTGQWKNALNCMTMNILYSMKLWQTYSCTYHKHSYDWMKIKWHCNNEHNVVIHKIGMNLQNGSKQTKNNNNKWIIIIIWRYEKQINGNVNIMIWSTMIKLNINDIFFI